MDTSIDNSPASDTDDESAEGVEIPVALDTLDVSGVNPDMGDDVEIKVKGKITRIVNGIAFVSPESVNDQPMETSPIKPNPATDEGSRLKQLSEQVDTQGGNYG